MCRAIFALWSCRGCFHSRQPHVKLTSAFFCVPPLSGQIRDLLMHPSDREYNVTFASLLKAFELAVKMQLCVTTGRALFCGHVHVRNRACFAFRIFVCLCSCSQGSSDRESIFCVFPRTREFKLREASRKKFARMSPRPWSTKESCRKRVTTSFRATKIRTHG